MTTPEVTLGTAREALQLIDQICDLYQAVFSEPPFLWKEDEPEAQRRRLEHLSADPTFGFSLAWVDSELVGFAYGVALAPGTRWWSGVTESLPEEITSEWTSRTFAVIDLAVSKYYRRQGIGRKLLHVLLNNRLEERATLAVQPVATETKNFYEHLGWRKVATTRAASGAVSPYFDLYVLTH